MVIQDCAGDGYCQMVLMVITTVALRTVTGDSANESGDGDNDGGDDNFSGGAGGEVNLVQERDQMAPDAVQYARALRPPYHLLSFLR